MLDLIRHPSITPVPGASGGLRFSLDGVPEREKPFMTREFFGRSLVKYDVECSPDARCDIDVTLQMMPGLLMMSGRGHGFCNKRTREMVAADASDDIGLIVNLSGARQATQGRKQFVLGDGEAVLVSHADLYSFVHRPPGDIQVLRVPRAPLAPLVTGVDDLCFRRIPGGTPALRFLLDYVKMAGHDQRVTRPELQHLFVEHVYDLMAVAIGATRDAAEMARGRGLRAARLHAIKQDIARDLDQPDLSVGALASRHRCTARFVQRLFEDEGTTFTDYVLQQRLACAHRLLTDPRHADQKIVAIALDAGFGDVSYFNRAFRKRYGETPSGVRYRCDSRHG